MVNCYLNRIKAISTASAGNGVRLVPFSFSVDDSYMLCFTHNRMYIIKNGVVQTNLRNLRKFLVTSVGQFRI